MTPLIYASQYDCIDIVNYLISQPGININYKDNRI